VSAIRVVLADDHTLVRAGIRTLLESIESVEVVGEASNGREALELVRKHLPDLVLLDIGMKEMDGLQAAAAIRQEHPQIKAIILSMHSTPDVVEQALRAGASAYLVKDAAITELELAVRAAMRGEVFLSPAVSAQIVAGYVQGDQARRLPDDALTARQQEVLQLIGSGKSTKEIARLLGISTKTVEAHRAQIMEKLGVRNVAKLMMEAVGRGLISVKKTDG
jgi:DNA-binding NarL/FixJ family response regulator